MNLKYWNEKIKETGIVIGGKRRILKKMTALAISKKFQENSSSGGGAENERHQNLAFALYFRKKNLKLASLHFLARVAWICVESFWNSGSEERNFPMKETKVSRASEASNFNPLLASKKENLKNFKNIWFLYERCVRSFRQSVLSRIKYIAMFSRLYSSRWHSHTTKKSQGQILREHNYRL